jgi:hypothetical protein
MPPTLLMVNILTDIYVWSLAFRKQPSRLIATYNLVPLPSLTFFGLK